MEERLKELRVSTSAACRARPLYHLGDERLGHARVLEARVRLDVGEAGQRGFGVGDGEAHVEAFAPGAHHDARGAHEVVTLDGRIRRYRLALARDGVRDDVV